MRVGTPKFQKAHGFRRGMPVARVGDKFVPATESTGFVGLVGSILSLDQFELVSSGELDGVSSLTGAGDGTVWHLSPDAGVLATTGTTAVGQVVGQQFLVSANGALQAITTPVPPWSNAVPVATTFRQAGHQGTSTAAMARQDHKHPLELNETLDRLADATEPGIAMALATSHDAQEALLGIALLRATLARYMTLDGSAHTGERTFLFPDQDGTVALLEREQTFTMRQSVLSDETQEANASWTLPADRVEIGHGVVAVGGYFYSRSGLEVITQGSFAHNFGLLCEFDPTTNKGSMVGWRDQRDGKIIGHVGIDVGAGRQFNMLTESDTTLDRNIYMRPSAQTACKFTYDVPTSLAVNTSIGEGRVLVKTDFGVGAVPDGFAYLVGFSADRWVEFRGALASLTSPNTTSIGGGNILVYKQTVGWAGEFRSIFGTGPNSGVYISVPDTGTFYGLQVDVGSVAALTVGTAPTAISDGQVKIGGSEIWTKGGTDYDDDLSGKVAGDEIRLSGGSGLFGWSVIVDDGSGSMSQLEGDELQFFTDNKAQFAAIRFDNATSDLSLDSDGSIYCNPASQFVITGTAPSSVSAGQVAIGGGDGWFAGSIFAGASFNSSGANVSTSANQAVIDYLSGARFAAWGPDNSTYGELLLQQRTANGTGRNVLYALSGGNVYVYGHDGTIGSFWSWYDTPNAAFRGYIGYGPTLFSSASISGFGIRSQAALHLASGGGYDRLVIDSNGISTFYGAAPSSVSAWQVAIGGGDGWFAGTIIGPKYRDTIEGGRAVKLTNRSGSTSIKGRLVQASQTYDDAYTISTADRPNVIGVEYESGVADGSECWVVTQGIADVLLQDSTASTHGYWAKQSDTVDGRADITNAFPPGGTIVALDDHGSEIGHCVQSVTAGTNKTARCVLHLN